jgi:hypothetical protein
VVVVADLTAVAEEGPAGLELLLDLQFLLVPTLLLLSVAAALRAQAAALAEGTEPTPYSLALPQLAVAVEGLEILLTPTTSVTAAAQVAVAQLPEALLAQAALHRLLVKVIKAVVEIPMVVHIV